MLKLGVCRADQYVHAGRGPWWRRDHVDYRLLRTAIPPSPLEVSVFESLTREMQLGSGVFRTTSQSRFRDLDGWVTPILTAHFDPAARLDVQDWAASDCMASLAWHDHLLETFPQARLTASDLNLYLIEMQIPAGSYVFEPNVGVLQFIAPPFVIRLSPAEPSTLIVNRILARRALARLEALKRESNVEPSSIEFADDVDEVQHGSLVFRKIPLVHPHARTRARATESFRVERHSVFRPSTQMAHVVRTMNILNVGYFDAATLERGARSVLDSLRPGGLWILGRTVQEDRPRHHVSVLVRTATGFQVQARQGDGSEVEDVALRVRG